MAKCNIIPTSKIELSAFGNAAKVTNSVINAKAVATMANTAAHIKITIIGFNVTFLIKSWLSPVATGVV